MAEARVEAGASTLPADDDPAVLGRPRVDVDLDDVEFLCSLKLNLTKVAALLGVSRSTIYHRMDRRIHSSDSAPDILIRGLKTDHLQHGEVMMAGHLTRIGVRIT